MSSVDMVVVTMVSVTLQLTDVPSSPPPSRCVRAPGGAAVVTELMPPRVQITWDVLPTLSPVTSPNMVAAPMVRWRLKGWSLKAVQ